MTTGKETIDELLIEVPNVRLSAKVKVERPMDFSVFYTITIVVNINNTRLVKSEEIEDIDIRNMDDIVSIVQTMLEKLIVTEAFKTINITKLFKGQYRYA